MSRVIMRVVVISLYFPIKWETGQVILFNDHLVLEYVVYALPHGGTVIGTTKWASCRTQPVDSIVHL